MSTTTDNESQDITRKRFCGMPRTVERVLPPDIDTGRASLIQVISKTWVNGTQIHYCFWSSVEHSSPEKWDGSDQDKEAVRAAWQEWNNIGIGLEFIEVSDPYEAEVRIGFDHTDGSWSYVGTDVLKRPLNERTMNFGWQLHGWDYGKATALHEIGHTLGLPHEHQNPNAGIRWDETNVIDELSGPPNNWSQDTIYWNILRKIPANEVYGSEWDPKSIMHYAFEPELIAAPEPYSTNGIPENVVLSENDKAFIQKFYPLINEDEYTELKPFRSVHRKLKAGDQLDFLIKPRRTRKYSIRTLGLVDTLLTLFERDGTHNTYLEADDDAGLGRNAKIVRKLFKNKIYILRLRFYYSSEEGNTLVVMF